MPLVTVFNLRRDDRLSDLEEATKRALTSMPELAITDWEINVVPVLMPDGFSGEVTRINVEASGNSLERRRPCKSLRRDSREPSGR